MMRCDYLQEENATAQKKLFHTCFFLIVKFKLNNSVFPLSPIQIGLWADLVFRSHLTESCFCDFKCSRYSVGPFWNKKPSPLAEQLRKRA